MSASIVECRICTKRYPWRPMDRGVCSIECAEEAQRRRLAKPCGACGQMIRLQIVNVFGGEEEVEVCGCETDL